MRVRPEFPLCAQLRFNLCSSPIYPTLVCPVVLDPSLARKSINVRMNLSHLSEQAPFGAALAPRKYTNLFQPQHDKLIVYRMLQPSHNLLSALCQHRRKVWIILARFKISRAVLFLLVFVLSFDCRESTRRRFPHSDKTASL